MRQVLVAQLLPGNPGNGRENTMELLKRIVREEEGQDLIEYALIAGFISVVCYTAIKLTGESVSDIWDTVQTAVADAAS
jgi:pilus assembly protein Flp/PilA